MEATTALRTPAVSPDGVLFCYSPNLGLRVRYGALVIDLVRGRSITTDRAGEPRLRRLVLAGHGWWSFEVQSWLAGVGASWVHLDLAGGVLGSGPGTISPDLPALRRAQALAAGTDAGLGIGVDLLTKKISGQAAALATVADTDAIQQLLREHIALLDGCSTVVELRTVEARAAAMFWEALAAMPVRFIPSDESKVPDAWRSIGRRSSVITGSPRGASTAAQSIWNFSYTIGAVETEIALRSVGLDPGISPTGLHADTGYRSAATWDLVEAIRGDIDRVMLGMVAGRRFRRREFAQLPDGRVRLTASLARELTEAVIPVARQAVAPVAEGVARTLASQTNGSPTQTRRMPTNLTGERRSRGRDGVRAGERRGSGAPRSAVRSLAPKVCQRCGIEIEKGGNRRYCDPCRADERAGHTEMLKVAGSAALAKYRQSGDEATYAAAHAKIGAKVAVRNRERAAWDRDHEPADPEVFRTDIWPGVRHVSTAKIVAATGLSRDFVVTIKSGKHVPHARHWATFRDLGLTTEDAET